ncbi:MAG TPA: type II secretion system protein, partial [Acidisarcina sp.]
MKTDSGNRLRYEQALQNESGFVLISVLFLVAMILLVLAVAAPRVVEDIRRDREAEFYHRGLQYKRAIKLYVRKMGHYPTSIDQLENTNDIRFLRRRYKDPITGKDEWRLIHLGEAKVPPMGLFGQPLTAGNPAAAVGSNIGDTSQPSVPATSAGDAPGAGGAGAAGGLASGGAGIGAPGTGAGPTDGSTSPSGSTTGGGSTGFIVGVSSNSTRESIRTYKNQTHYNQWEFVYN